MKSTAHVFTNSVSPFSVFLCERHICCGLDLFLYNIKLDIKTCIVDTKQQLDKISCIYFLHTVTTLWYTTGLTSLFGAYFNWISFKNNQPSYLFVCLFYMYVPIENVSLILWRNQVPAIDEEPSILALKAVAVKVL